MQTKTGTLAFSAPEMFEMSEYDEKVDMWSAGILLYMMLSGEHPFDSGNISVSQVIQNILQGQSIIFRTIHDKENETWSSISG